MEKAVKDFFFTMYSQHFSQHLMMPFSKVPLDVKCLETVRG